MRYIIRAEPQDDLEDLVNDEELDLVHRFKHIPYTTVETPLDYDQIRQRYPDYHITEDKTYDTQKPDRDGIQD